MSPKVVRIACMWVESPYDITLAACPKIGRGNRKCVWCVCVCVCVCAHVCMYVCMYMYVHVYMYVCMCV